VAGRCAQEQEAHSRPAKVAPPRAGRGPEVRAEIGPVKLPDVWPKETAHGYDHSPHYRRYRAFAGRGWLLWTGTLVVKSIELSAPESKFRLGAGMGPLSLRARLRPPQKTIASIGSPGLNAHRNSTEVGQENWRRPALASHSIFRHARRHQLSSKARVRNQCSSASGWFGTNIAILLRSAIREQGTAGQMRPARHRRLMSQAVAERRQS
jgi:hypothetical protein